MATGYNKVILYGNLTRDPEVRNAGQYKVCQIGLAVSRRVGRGDDARDETSFIDCEAWGKTGELIAAHMRKGRSILVDGYLKMDQWEKDGEKRSKLKVVIDAFQFTDGKQESPRGQSQPSTRVTKPAYEALDDSSIPF